MSQRSVAGQLRPNTRRVRAQEQSAGAAGGLSRAHTATGWPGCDGEFGPGIRSESIGVRDQASGRHPITDPISEFLDPGDERRNDATD
jgi:hypothetical protein